MKRLLGILLGLLIIGMTAEVSYVEGNIDEWILVSEGVATGYYDSPLGTGTTYNSAAVERYYDWWWDGYGYVYQFKESAAGADREGGYPGMIVKQGVDLIKVGGDFSFLANPSDPQVAGAFPYSGIAGYFEDIAQDIAEIIIGNLPYGVGYAYTAVQFAYNLKKGYDVLNDPGNVYFRWTTYGSDVGHFTRWFVEVRGSYATFKVISKMYYTSYTSVNVAMTIRIDAPSSYSPEVAIKNSNLAGRLIQDIKYRISGIGKYTINFDGTLRTVYKINPKAVEKYKDKFNIPEIVIQRALEKNSPIYLIRGPAKVRVLSIETYTEKEGRG